uniref:Predicted protein n=1 Tax=Hordeum vulgare subsp. vulgare TaxID=112509 RepID=F2E4P2_HORVV|nr:predicted protein [Hordeum vulgare subsp. vulgare]
MRIFLLQISPWQKIIHIFLSVTPIRVIPAATFSSRQAHQAGIISTL